MGEPDDSPEDHLADVLCEVEMLFFAARKKARLCEGRWIALREELDELLEGRIVGVRSVLRIMDRLEADEAADE